MDDKLIYIPNDAKQNYPICRLKLLLKSLNTTSFEPTNKVFFMSEAKDLENCSTELNVLFGKAL